MRTRVKTIYEKNVKPNKGLCRKCYKMINCNTKAIKIIRTGYTLGWYHMECKPFGIKLVNEKTVFEGEPVITEEKKETTSEYLKRIGALS